MVHLHVHTHIGSILDGMGKPSDYAILANKYSQKACAITDHGRLGGLFDFQEKMLEQEIKPILGCEMYVSDQLMVSDDKGKRKRTKNSHIILLTKNEIGYKNLLMLNWLSMQDDHFYYLPRIIHEELLKYSEGLIMGTACMGSKSGRFILNDIPNYELAEKAFKEYLDIFKDNFYGEIQLNELEPQKSYNEFIIKTCNKFGVPICITGDVHYSNPEDAKTQTLSIMIARNQTIDDMGKEDFFEIEAKNLFFTNEKHIHQFNKDFGFNYNEDFINQCLKNTEYVADKVEYKIPERTKFFIPHFENKEKILKEKIQKGIKKLFPDGFPISYSERLKIEYSLIKEANLIDYFLIVEDYHDYAKKLGDFCAIGRGSGAGSLILYLLGITALDPIKHDLIFERFITAERVKNDYPDIDSDFSPDIKEKVQSYLIEKYSSDKVFHVCTYTTFGLKMAAKDILRIYKVDYTQSNNFTKELDNDLSWAENIANFEETKPALFEFYKQNKEILDLTPKFNGLVRNMGVHAGGLAILSGIINEIIPVDRVSGVVTTAFQESGSCQELDKVGVIKFDILGVKTLGVIKETLNLIGDEALKDKLYNLDLTDPGIYEEANNENKYNLFQMNGKAYAEIADKVKPQNWEEINACNAMARPGTKMFLPQYLEGKLGKSKYPEKVKEILKDTYYVCLYQEQAMEIFHKIGGFTLEEADYVRGIMKRLSKKDKKPQDLVMWKKINDKFKLQAKKQGLTEQQIIDITEDLINFSNYSFNKSHCYAYSYIGAITAYLAHYYRPEFYCASLNGENESEKIMEGLNACRLNNIKILPPDINDSDSLFSITPNKDLIFGLKGIKYVGEKAIEIIVQNRPYKNFKDFITCSNIRCRNITSRVIESLICSGCFDKTDGKENRKYLLQLSRLFWENRRDYKNRPDLERVYSLSEKNIQAFPGLHTTDVDLETWEKEFLGYNFFTTKFTEDVFQKVQDMKINFYKHITEIQQPKPALVEISKMRVFNDKNKNEMAFVTLKDELNQEIKIPLFASVWKYIKETIKLNSIYLIVLRNSDEQIMFGRTGFLTEQEVKKSILLIK